MLEPILELHKQGRLDEAESRYRELLSFNPDDPETLHLLGILRRQRGDFREGVELVRRAIERAPDRYTYYLTLGGMELHLRALDHARADFETALRLNPSLPSAYSALGHIALLQGDPQRAEESFKVALNAGDARLETLSGYGRALLERGDIDMALKYLASAVQAKPDDPVAQATLGRAYLAKRMHAFAQRALENALALKPDYHVARRLLVESQLAEQKFADAERHVRALAAHADQRATAFALSGDVARARGDLEAAVGHYRDAVVARPREAGVVGALAWCLRRLRRHREAIDAWQNYLAERPGDADALRAIGALAAGSGDLELARKSFRAVLREQPDDVASRSALAAMLELGGDLDEAEREADSVLAAGADAVAALVKSRAHLRAGRHGAARTLLATLDLSALNAPQKYAALSLHGLALDHSGDHDLAVADWLQAHKVAPGVAWPALTDIPAGIESASAQARAAGPVAGARAPAALLIGLPGGGAELVAGLLQGEPGVAVAADRIGGGGRSDGFAAGESRYLDLDDDQAQVVARRYARALERLHLPADIALVDWLPFWDAQFAPMAWRSLGEVKLIVVGREPREALLQWLALGCAQGYRIADLASAARWLAAAAPHLAATVASSGLPILELDADAVLADPRRARSQVMQFLGRSASAAEPAPIRGLGGMPVALPDRSAARYAQALRAAFDALAAGVPT